jgi:hypothetical protein
MAKKQTRRSISVSRTTYERLKAFCEANNVSMSQFVETRVGDFLGSDVIVPPRPAAPRPAPMSMPAQTSAQPRPVPSSHPAAAAPAPAPRPATPALSVAARYAVDPPPPIIKPKTEQPAPAPAAKTADQIFTF